MESFILSSIQGLGAAQLSARPGCGCMEMINASRAVHADLSGSKPKRGGRDRANQPYLGSIQLRE